MLARPILRVKGDIFKNDEGTFLVDTGCPLNLVKESALTKIFRRRDNSIFYLAGVGKGIYETLGSVELFIFDRKTIFHIIPEDFGVSTSGILGMEFLHENSASLKFQDGETILDLPLSEQANINYSLPPRTRKLIALSVVDNGVREGLLERIETEEGVIIPDGIVSCVNGTVKVFAINPTDDAVHVKIHPVEIQGCDLQQVEVGHVDAIETEPCPARMRLNRLLEIINLSSLTQEEKDTLYGPLEKYSHCFYLDGDTLKATNVVAHEIRTTDDDPIFQKQYRPAEALNDEILKQTRELYEMRFVEDSDSPYNSPVWMVPKKPGPDGERRWRIVIEIGRAHV